MYIESRYKRSLAALATLVFLLSANVLLFASHVADEMQVAFTSSYLNPENPHPTDHHHSHGEEDDHGGGNPHRDCCNAHVQHSHDLTDASTPALNSSPVAVVFLTFFESVAYLPEVFLDRFVPPQNLA